jgi:pimeloyl-ACP methyl ester carboxylesterase
LKINDLNIHYEVSGKGRPLLLLHGWGCDVQIFKPLLPFLEPYFMVYRLDFPGFGKSSEPPTAWTNDDYVTFTQQFIAALDLKDAPIVLGHSFGGRVAIKLATQIPLRKLILTGSAGIKPTRKPSYYFKIYAYKLLKVLVKVPILGLLLKPLQENYVSRVGSSDYKQASAVMRQTLSNVVNTDLQTIMPHVKVPTLLLWGENDTATPPEYGQKMEKLIPDAGLVVLKNAGHYVFLDQLQQFQIILNSFLEKDKI